MRVLLLHNRYRKQGGEERALAQTATLLTGKGHDVDIFERASGDVTPARAARALARGGDPDTLDDLRRELERLRPDVVHAHNVHPLLGWRALLAARAAGARTVLTLHNYRLFCATGVAYRAGAPCHACHGRDTLPGLAHRCRGNVREAAVYAAGLARAARRLPDAADRLVALAESQAAVLRAQGLVGPDLDVAPNFVPAASLAPSSAADRGEYALVAGRLVAEKGFDTAVRAARAAGVSLVVSGTGPDEPRLRGLAAGGDVRFTGWLPGPELARVRARAGLVLVPSRWEEVCPFAVLEAFAAGVPVLASDRGGLPELLASGHEPARSRSAPDFEPVAGAVVPAGDDAAWERELRAWWTDPVRRRRSGDAALGLAATRYGEERAYAARAHIYGWEP